MVKYLGKGEKSCIFKVFLQLHPEVVRVIFFSNSIPYIRYWPKKAIIKNSFFFAFFSYLLLLGPMVSPIKLK